MGFPKADITAQATREPSTSVLKRSLNMENNQQAQNGTAAGTASGTAAGASSQAGSESTVVGNSVVEAGQNTSGNSGNSDGSNGSTGDGERGRPSRAERRIDELTAKIRESEAELAKRDSLIKQLTDSPLDYSKVKLPDYSQMDQVTDEQIRKDVATAADQIATMRTSQAIEAFEDRLTRRESAGKALSEIDAMKAKYAVLNPAKEGVYNEKVERFLGDSFYKIFQKDPSYSFREHVENYFNAVGVPETNTSSEEGPASSDARSSKGTTAIRGGSGNARATKDINAMTSDELEAYIKSKNGR